MKKDVKKRVFEQYKADSSSFTALDSDDWKQDSEYYKEKVKFLFKGVPENVSFNRLTSLPFSFQLGAEQTNLKPLVVPYYNNINSVIRLVRSNNDNCSFIQKGDTETARYRIEIHEVKLAVYRLRFSEIGYALNAAKLFKNTQGSVGLPSLCLRMDSEPLSPTGLWFSKTYENIACPSKILLFRMKSAYLSGGSTTPYSTTDDDEWQKFKLNSYTVKWNNLELYNDR